MAWNINKALQKAESVKTRTSSGKCAMYVRQFLEAGGLDLTGHPVSAKDYSSFLPKLGFVNIANIASRAEQTKFTDNDAIPGDVAVMEHGQHGHICMYTGKYWVSDFIQNNIWPYQGDGLVSIFRLS